MVQRIDSIGRLPLIPVPSPAGQASQPTPSPNASAAIPSDNYRPSGVVSSPVNTALRAAYNGVQAFLDGVWQRITPQPLSDNAHYFFDTLIPLEVQQLARKWKNGTLTETERLRLETYLAMNKIANRYDFLDRIARGDLSTVDDHVRQAKHQLFVSLGDVTADGRVVQNGDPIDPQFAVINGHRALITRDGQHKMIPLRDLQVIRHFTKDKDEFDFVDRILKGDLSTSDDHVSQGKYQLFISVADVTADGRVILNGEAIDPRFAFIKGGRALVVRDGQNRLIPASTLLIMYRYGRDKVETFTSAYMADKQAEQERNKLRNMLKVNGVGSLQ